MASRNGSFVDELSAVYCDGIAAGLRPRSSA